MKNTTMKINCWKLEDGNEVPMLSTATLDGFEWNGKYRITVSDDDGSLGLPFLFATDDTAILTVETTEQEGMGTDDKKIKQVISCVPRSLGNEITCSRTRSYKGKEHVWSAWETISSASGTKVTWDASSCVDTFITAGIYNISGERLNVKDGLPIANSNPGHTIKARLVVLDSSISGTGDTDDKCITQILTLSNRTGGDGDVYIRTGRAHSTNVLAGGSGWEPWGKLQQNIEVGQVTSLNNFIGNGIYSGVYTNGSSFFETFVMVVINNYAVAGATGQVRSISQFKYALNVDSTFSYKTRTGRGNTGIEWGSWVDLGATTTTDIQDNSITAQKLSGDVREKVEKVQELSTGIADVRGFSILANFQVPVQSNVKVVGRIEFPAVMKNGTLLYLKYVQNYTVGNNGIRFYQNSAVAANLITPKRNGLVKLNQDCNKIVVSTDCSVEGSIDVSVSKKDIVSESKREVRILSIGNSFSQDAFCYMPYILQNIAPDIKLIFGIAYYSGSSLQQHLKFFEDESAVYKLDKWTWENYRWNATSDLTLQDCLRNEMWDVVVFQQNSGNSGDYATISPYLNPLVKSVSTLLARPVKLAWLLTPSNKTNYDESVTHYCSISEVAQQVLQNSPIDMLFPCGTAIQNARTTSLKNLGDGGNLLHTSLHLQEGVPCLIEAYVAAMVVARSVGNNICSVHGEGSIVDSAWLNGKFIPGTNGTPDGSNEENCRIAQIAAIAAMKNPLEVTDVSYADNA